MKNFYAKGRMKQGQLNKTEAAYQDYLELLKAAGEILWYRFEGIKLRLTDNTFLTVDFAILNLDGFIELHDVKPSFTFIMDDAKAKMKIAAGMYPFIFKIVVKQPKKLGGGWEVREI